MAVAVADADASGNVTMLSDDDRADDCERAIVADEGAVADLKARVAPDAVGAEGERRFAGKADVRADDDVAVTDDVREGFHLEAFADGFALAAEEGFEPKKA